MTENEYNQIKKAFEFMGINVLLRQIKNYVSKDIGYDKISMYNKLILRNVNILKNLNDLSIEIIIFHEGNILKNQQIYIESQTPVLNIKFIVFKFFLNLFSFNKI